MMKSFKRVFAGLLSVMFLLTVSVMSVKAVGNTTIYLSGSSISVGETLTVDISGSESSKLKIKYTQEVLSLTGCSVSEYTQDGNTISVSAKDVKLTFTGAASGKANIIVTSDSLTGSSAAITVGDGAAAASSDTSDASAADAAVTSENDAAASSDVSANDASQAEDTSLADDYEAAASEEEAALYGDSDALNGLNVYHASTESGDYLINGIPYVVSERWSESEVPAGFSRVDVTIHDKTYKEISNGAITLVYLKPEANTSGQGTFFIYDPAADTVADLFLVGSLTDYVIAMTPESLWNRNLTLVDLTLADGTAVRAYQVNGVESGFYYIYGMDENVGVDWYSYDSAAGTIQRADVNLLSLTNTTKEQIYDDVNAELAEEDDEEEEGLTHMEQVKKLYEHRRLIAILIFVLALVIVIVLNVRAEKKRREAEGIIFDDEDGSDDGYPEYEGDGYDEDGEYDDEGYEDEEYYEDGEYDEEDSYDEADMPDDEPAGQADESVPAAASAEPEIDVESQVMASLEAVLADEVAQEMADEKKPKPAAAEEEELSIIDFNDL